MKDEKPKDKVISLRLDPTVYDSIKNNGEAEKISTKLHKIIQNHMESLYTANHNWVSMPPQLVGYLLKLLDDEKIKEYCDVLEQEVYKVHQSEFPDKSIWETWLTLEKDWNKQMHNVYSIKKTNDSFRFYIEHNADLQSSKIIHGMFERFSKGFAEVKKIEMDSNKLVMEIREL